MKIFISISILVYLLISFTADAQVESKTLKTLNDSVFEVGDKLKSPQIAFQLSAGSYILPKYQDSVRVIADFLNKNPKINIEIGVHSDIRGAEESNERFTKIEANRVKEMLIDKFSIPEERVVAKGYGESEPIITQEEISKAETGDEKERLYGINRRVEIKIIKN